MLSCMQAARAQVADELSDKRQHCLASALIARHCSVGEAYVAGIAKELSDLFGPGDAEWADWRADRAGVDCARRADAEIAPCCAQQGY